MADWLTWEAAKGITSALASFWKRVSSTVRTLRAERQAAEDGTLPPAHLDSAIDEVIKRLVGEARDDGLLAATRVHGGHTVIAVGIFRRPAVREWLRLHTVQEDLRQAARDSFLNCAAQGAGPQISTLAAYERATGEHRPSAEAAFSQTVGVIVASLRAKFDATAAVATAASAFHADRVIERIDDLEHRSATPPNVAAAGESALTARLNNEMRRLLARRSLVPEGETREALRSLLVRIEQGELRGVATGAHARVLWWLARFAASDAGSDYDALVARARTLNPHADFIAHEALRLDASGRTDAALQMLRERDEPDAQTILFSLLIKKERAADALAWLGEVDDLEISRLTAVGWRNLASTLVLEGRFADAARVLARCTPEHEAECPDILYVRGMARAACLYPEYAREAFWHGVVPVGVATYEGSDANTMHTGAVADLNRASVAFGSLDLSERSRNAYVCALALRLGCATTRDAARSDLAQEMARPPSPPIDLIGLALEYGIEFDQESVEVRLARAERLGELSPQEIEARIALLQHQHPAQLAIYLETKAAVLAAFLTPARVAGLRIEALARTGDIVRAQQVLAEGRDLFGDDHERLSALIDSQAGLDPTDALARLAQTTGEPLDFENLCRILEHKQNWSALITPSQQLVAKVPNTQNLLRVVVALQRSRSPDMAVLSALDEHPTLTKGDQRLSLARAHALLGAGRIADAVALTRELYAECGGADEAVAACNAAILSGDWEALREIAVKEVMNRERREPAYLAWLGMVCGDQDEGAALVFVREAAGREDADSITLLRCANAALRAGVDNEAFGWIRRAHDLSGDSGPVQALDQSRAVSVLIERAEQSRSIGELLSSGQIPVHLAAEALGIGLGRLLLQNLITNARQPDGRRRSVIPLRPGSRPLTPPSGVRRPIVDVTSLLILAYLDALPLLDRAFDEVVLPWSTMVVLRQETDRLRHHQRSMVLQAQQLRDLLASGILKRLPAWRGRREGSVETEAGLELAELLSRASAVRGRVVHTALISRVGADDEELAQLGDLAQIVLTTRQFAEMLRARAALDQDRFATATAVLEQHDAAPPPGPAYSEGPLFLSWLAVAYLQPLGLLNVLGQAGLNAFVSDEVAEEALAHKDQEADALEMSQALRRVREWYKNGLAAGKVRVAPRLRGTGDVDEEDDNERGSGRISTLKEFLLAPDCDGALIDDRHLLRHTNIERPRGPVPVFGTLDLLRHLAGSPLLPTEQHWNLRHRLRTGGVACVSLDAEELRYHLGHLNIESPGESAELRAIREATAALQIRNVLILPDDEPFLSSLLITACATIRQVWADTDLSIDVVRQRADWVWDHVAPKPLDWWHRLKSEGRSNPTVDVFRSTLGLLLPLFVMGRERRRAARSWLEERVLSPWWTDPAFRQVAADVARTHILEFSANLPPNFEQADVADELLAQLPSALAAELRADAAFLEAVGLNERLPLAGAGSDIVFSRPQMLAAARAALSGQSATARDLRHDRDVEFTAAEGLVTLNWEEDGQRQQREAPADLALLSPHVEDRIRALEQLVEAAGPSGPDPSHWRPIVKGKALADVDFETIVEETVNAVPIRLARAARALSQGVLDLDLIVPKDIRYWEGLCGDAPASLTQDEWLSSVWRPRARRLLATFGGQGFRLIAAANGKPGFIDSCATPPADVLASLQTEAQLEWGPLARLAFIEARANHLSADTAQMAMELVSDLSRKDSHEAERTEIFAGLFRLVWRTLLVRPCMAGQPSWWIRLCGLTQAEMLLAPFISVQTNVSEFLKSMRELAPAGGHWAELLSLREEPLWRPEMVSADWLRAEMLGRLAALIARVGDSEDAERAVIAAGAAGSAIGYPLAGFSPGPLECVALPHTAPDLDPDLDKALDLAVQALEGEPPAPGAWCFLDFASRHVRLGDARLAKFASVASGWKPGSDSSDERWSPLFHLARAAAAQRDTHLAEAILQTLRAAPESLEDSAAALQIALTASAAWPDCKEAVSRFADVSLSLAWRARRPGCASIEAVLESVAVHLPIAAAWQLSLPLVVARLGANSRGE